MTEIGQGKIRPKPYFSYDQYYYPDKTNRLFEEKRKVKESGIRIYFFAVRISKNIINTGNELVCVQKKDLLRLIKDWVLFSLFLRIFGHFSLHKTKIPTLFPLLLVFKQEAMGTRLNKHTNYCPYQIEYATIISLHI